MRDTVKAEIRPIEEGLLLQDSFRFESEPWTSFYMAGEIIREWRKACRNQSKYASVGNTAHSDEVIDHGNRPRIIGSQSKDDPNGAAAWSALESM